MKGGQQQAAAIVKGRAFILEQPMTGPESGGIQFCMACHRSLLRGEHWRKVWAADGSYAVGVHEACMAAAQA